LRRALAIRSRNGRHARNPTIGVARTRRHHARLTVHHVAVLGRETRSRRIVDRTVDVATWNSSGGSLLHPNLIALGNLALKLLPANLTTLGERNVQRLASDHLVVHLSDSLGSLVGRGKTNEAKPFGNALFIAHDLAASDAAKGLEFDAKLFIVKVILQVLDVEVDALVLGQLLEFGLLVGATEFFLALGLLLSACNKQFLAIHLGIVKLINRLLSLLVLLEIDKSEALALPLLVSSDEGRSNAAELGEKFVELLLVDLVVHVLDVKIRELSLHLVEFGLTLLIKSHEQNYQRLDQVIKTLREMWWPT
jgi:hypothetical protein